MSDYENGYMKPPVDKQFQPGQSGNPKGRPKGVRNLHTIVQEELDELVAVTTSGKKKKLHKKIVIIKAAFNKAASGNLKAVQIAIDLMREIETRNELKEAVLSELNRNDLEIIENFKNRLLNEQNKEVIDV